MKARRCQSEWATGWRSRAKSAPSLDRAIADDQPCAAARPFHPPDGAAGPHVQPLGQGRKKRTVSAREAPIAVFRAIPVSHEIGGRGVREAGAVEIAIEQFEKAVPFAARLQRFTGAVVRWRVVAQPLGERLHRGPGLRLLGPGIAK